MKCPMTGWRVECGSDCEWYVRSRHKVRGVPVEEKGCVIVALMRELARRNE